MVRQQIEMKLSRIVFLTIFIVLTTCATQRELVFEGFNRPVVCEKQEDEIWICTLQIDDFLKMLFKSQCETWSF